MHNREKHIDYNLLMRFIAGEADKEQKKHVLEWLGASEENQKLFDQLEAVWIESGRVDPSPVAVDHALAWKKVRSVIKNREKTTPQESLIEQSEVKRLRVIRRIAAVFLVLIVAGIALYLGMFRPPEPVDLVSTDVLLSNQLPDETVVDLNKNSSIRYPETFSGKNREVHLEGEAYFEVKENKERPFIIRTDLADITVLGTAFNVVAYPGTQKVEVFVESGKVLFTDKRSNASNSLILDAGDFGVLDNARGIFTKQNPPGKNQLYWKTKKLDFRDVELAQVFHTLEQHFDVSIMLENPQIANCRLTVSFDSEDLDYMLAVISATSDLTYELENDEYLIKGEGCD